MSVRETSEQVKASIQDYAKIYDVSAEVHSDDFIFWFIHDDPNRTNKEEAVMEYFQSGWAGAKFVKDLLDEHPLSTMLKDRSSVDRPPSFLEFASGYGRVTRHFPQVMPGFDVTACDIHPEAVRFLRSIGLAACTSTHSPDDFELGRPFDVIYAFSFFTHMPRSTWTRWLEVLGRHLTPNGLLVVTTHGKTSQDLMAVKSLEPDGFFFHAVSEQKDLSVAEYGNTITTFDFVYHQLALAKLRLVQFRESGAGQQDLFLLKRDLSATKPWGAAEGAAEVERVQAELEMVIESDRRRTMAEKLQATAASEAERLRAKDMAAAEIDQLRREVNRIYASRSWKVTAPLRAVTRAFAGRD